MRRQLTSIANQEIKRIQDVVCRLYNVYLGANVGGLAQKGADQIILNTKTTDEKTHFVQCHGLFFKSVMQNNLLLNRLR